MRISKMFSVFMFAFLATICANRSFGKGLTKEMIMRNGLTDAQIDSIFACRTNAELKLTRESWMNMQYRLHRFDNMRNWLNMGINGTLGDEILRVSDTNKVYLSKIVDLNSSIFRLKAETNYLGSAVQQWKDESSLAWSKYYAETNTTAKLQASISASVSNLVERKTALEEKIDDSTYLLLRPFLKLELAAIEKIIDRLNGEEIE